MVVDLYHGDPVKDFTAAYASGIRGIIHKATQGAGVADPLYAVRRQAAKDTGMLWGAYHFNTGDTVQAQVQHFLDVAEPDANTFMALDFEDNTHGNMTIDQARQFLELLDQSLGRPAAIYSGNRIKETQPDADPFFGSHKLWLCEYGPVARLPASWDKYFLWQFTGDGIGPQPHTVPGIQVNGLDINTFDGTPEELAAQWAS